MKKSLALILVAVAVFLLPQQAEAAAAPSILLEEALLWSGLLDEGDLLLIVRYEVPADGALTLESGTISPCSDGLDWDNCSPSDIYISIEDESGTPIRGLISSLERLGPALAGFYLSKGELAEIPEIDFEDPTKDDFSVRMFASPLRFTSSDQPKITPERPVVLGSDGTLSSVHETLLRLVEREIQGRNIGSDATNPYVFAFGELAEDGRITPRGREFATSITPLLVVAIPGAFQLAGTLISESAGVDYLTTLSRNANTGDTALFVENVSIFRESQIISLIGANGQRDVVQVTIVDEAVSALFIDGDPTTDGVQTLSQTYLRITPTYVVITGALSITEYGDNATKTTLHHLLGFFGVSNWVGGVAVLLFITLTVGTIGAAFCESWAGGLGIFPIALFLTTDLGIVSGALLFTIVLIFLIGSAIMYARGIIK